MPDEKAVYTREIDKIILDAYESGPWKANGWRLYRHREVGEPLETYLDPIAELEWTPSTPVEDNDEWHTINIWNEGSVSTGSTADDRFPLLDYEDLRSLADMAERLKTEIEKGKVK